MSIALHPARARRAAPRPTLATALAGALRTVLSWPARVHAHRALMRTMGQMTDRELADVGLIRQDLADVESLPLGSDAGFFFAARVSARRRLR